MELKDLREQLDAVDAVLEEKFIERMEIVRQIGELKKLRGLPVLDASREAQVLEKHLAGTPDPLKPYMEEFFKAVMAQSRSLQSREYAAEDDHLQKSDCAAEGGQLQKSDCATKSNKLQRNEHVAASGNTADAAEAEPEKHCTPSKEPGSDA